MKKLVTKPIICF